MTKKRTAEWLKETLSQHNMTQKTLAKLSGLSIFAIAKIVSGERVGSDVSWRAIENVFDIYPTEVLITKSNGEMTSLMLKGNIKPYYEMVEIARKNGFSEEIIIEYLKAIYQVFNKMFDNYDSSDEKNTNVLNILKEIGNNVVNDIETLSKYFENWIIGEKGEKQS